MFSRVEEERLEYIHSDHLEQIDEAMHRRNAAFVANPDHTPKLSSAVTLPSFFVGS